MAYSKLDDQFHSHAKLHRAKGQANAVAGVYARSLSYCGSGLTDGFVDGYWARSIASPKLLAQVTFVELWTPVQKGDQHTVTERKDSGRRKRPDVTVTMPSDGYFITDYLHFNASRAELREHRNSGTSARAGEIANARTGESANGAAMRSPTSPGPREDLLQTLQAVSPRAGPIDRLLEVLPDSDEGTKSVLSKMALELHLAEGDFEYAREAAQGPGVRSPTRVAVKALQKRAAERAKANA